MATVSINALTASSNDLLRQIIAELRVHSEQQKLGFNVFDEPSEMRADALLDTASGVAVTS